MLRCLKAPVLALAMTLAGLPAAAATVTYGFSNIPGGATGGDHLAGAFRVEVTRLSAGEVLFRFRNVSTDPDNFFIGQIYVDQTDATPVLTSGPAGDSSAYAIGQVAFAPHANRNMPERNLLTPRFEADWAFNRITGNANRAGIQAGEAAGFVFGGSFGTILAAIESRVLRFGINVQAIGPRGAEVQDRYVNATTRIAAEVPLPAAGWMLLLALGGLRLMGRTRRA